MANPEHHKILVEGVDNWNEWRAKNPNHTPDLSRIDLSETNFQGAELSNVYFGRSDLSHANLSGCNLRNAELNQVFMFGAKAVSSNLEHALINGANLTQVDFTNANLRAILHGSVLDDATLNGADLTGADLENSVFKHTNVNNANFTEAHMGLTVFADTNLSHANALQTCRHSYPSMIDSKTLSKSGILPREFLRGCGLSDWEIESTKLYDPLLTTNNLDSVLYEIHGLRAGKAVQIRSLFISYSHSDSTFVDLLEKGLDGLGIRFWRDIHHATAGRFEKMIDRAIRLNPILLLVLSNNSVKSDWVQHEVRQARQLEIETGRDVLCPVAIDESWKKSPWPDRLQEQIAEYNILDFSEWHVESTFQVMFAKLIQGLQLFYRK